GALKHMTSTKPTHRTRRVLAALTLPALAALAAAALWAPSAGADLSDFGLDSSSASVSTTQAGAHPDLTVAFTLKLDGNGDPFAQAKQVKIDLPPGLIGNPQAYPKCPMVEFGSIFTPDGNSGGGQCPVDSQVGVVATDLG